MTENSSEGIITSDLPEGFKDSGGLIVPTPGKLSLSNPTSDLSIPPNKIALPPKVPDKIEIAQIPIESKSQESQKITDIVKIISNPTAYVINSLSSGYKNQPQLKEIAQSIRDEYQVKPTPYHISQTKKEVKIFDKYTQKSEVKTTTMPSPLESVLLDILEIVHDIKDSHQLIDHLTAKSLIIGQAQNLLSKYSESLNSSLPSLETPFFTSSLIEILNQSPTFNRADIEVDLREVAKNRLEFIHRQEKLENTKPEVLETLEKHSIDQTKSGIQIASSSPEIQKLLTTDGYQEITDIDLPTSTDTDPLAEAQMKFRYQIYSLLETTHPSPKQMEEIIHIMDTHKDLDHRLAFHITTKLSQENPDSPWIQEQQKRYESLYSQLSQDPQTLLEEYPQIMEEAKSIVLPHSPLETPKGKVSFEFETLSSHLITHQLPEGLKAEFDAQNVLEIKRGKSSLDMNSLPTQLSQLSVWIQQNVDSVQSMHIHVDKNTQPHITDLKSLFIDSHTEVRDKHKINTWETRNIFAPLLQGSISPTSTYSIIHLLKNYRPSESQQILDFPTSLPITKSNLAWGHLVSSTENPESRLAAILSLKNPTFLETMNPYSTLLSFNSEAPQFPLEQVILSLRNSPHHTSLLDRLSESSNIDFKMITSALRYINEHDTNPSHSHFINNLIQQATKLHQKIIIIQIMQHIPLEGIKEQVVSLATENNETVKVHLSRLLACQADTAVELFPQIITNLSRERLETTSHQALVIMSKRPLLFKNTLLEFVDHQYIANRELLAELINKNTEIFIDNPDTIIQLSKDSDEFIRINSLFAMSKYPQIFSDQISSLASDKSIKIKIKVLKTVKNNPQFFKNRQKIVDDLLVDLNLQVKDEVFSVMVNEPDIFLDQIKTLVNSKSVDLKTKRSILKAIGDSPKTIEEHKSVVINIFENSDHTTMIDASKIITKHPKIFTQQIYSLLNNESWVIKEKLARGIADNPAEFLDFPDIIIKLANAPEIMVREHTLKAMVFYPEKFKDQLFQMAEDEYWGNRSILAKTIAESPKIFIDHPEIVDKLLTDPEFDVRNNAANGVLLHSKDFKKQITHIVNSDNNHLKHLVAVHMRENPTAYETSRELVIQLANDPNSEIKHHAITSMKHNPVAFAQQLIKSSEEEGWKARFSAIKVMGNNPELFPDAIIKMASDKRSSIRYEVAIAISKNPELFKNHLKTILKLSQDENSYTRFVLKEMFYNSKVFEHIPKKTLQSYLSPPKKEEELSHKDLEKKRLKKFKNIVKYIKYSDLKSWKKLVINYQKNPSLYEKQLSKYLKSEIWIRRQKAKILLGLPVDFDYELYSDKNRNERHLTELNVLLANHTPENYPPK